MTSPLPASVRTPLKRFSHSQIADKVRERSGVAEYEALLMSAAVQQDDSGVVFDSTAPGWKELVRRCEQADRDSERRRKETAAQRITPAGTGGESVAARSPSPSPALPVSHASAAATSLLSKLSAAISTKSSGVEPSEDERDPKAGRAEVGEALANGGRASSMRGVPAVPHRTPVAARVRRGSQPTAATALQPNSNTAQPATTSDSDTQRDRRAKRASAAPALHSSNHSAHEANTATGVSGESESSSDSRRIRSVRMLHSAAHRTNADRIKRSANKQIRDAQQLQADLSFEQRLSEEVDGKYSEQQLSADWRDRRQRENEREAERKRREEEAEAQRIAAGGRKKRKLVIPSAGQIRQAISGEPVDELDYMDVLLQQLSEPDDSRVDWRLTAQLASVTGLPHKHRMRVWAVMLKQSAVVSEEQQQQQQQPQPEERRESEDEELDAAMSGVTLSADATSEAAVSPSGSDSASLPSSSLPSPKLDLINQRTVRVDIDRTLPHFARMQRHDVKHDMEVILTAYANNSAMPHTHSDYHMCSIQHSQATHSLCTLLSFMFSIGCPVTASVTTSLTSRV